MNVARIVRMVQVIADAGGHYSDLGRSEWSEDSYLCARERAALDLGFHGQLGYQLCCSGDDGEHYYWVYYFCGDSDDHAQHLNAVRFVLGSWGFDVFNLDGSSVPWKWGTARDVR